MSLAMWPILWSLALPADGVLSEIASDEIVVFYPTYAHRTSDEKSWVVHVHGQIFEPEANSLRRAALIGVLRRSLGLSKDEAQTETFKERVRAFLVDNERNKTIHIRLGDGVYRAGKSGPNGHFSSDLVLSNETVEALHAASKDKERVLRFKAVTRAADTREFVGEVELIEPRGLSVFSDVDDTIKISDVADRRALLANTFLREYKPVNGMAELYRRWNELGAKFHYVSGSPWQLYRPISKFLVDERFPRGSLHMKMFRLKDSSAMALVGSQQKYKPDVIVKILTDFPHRQFILVGDSGEDDPEIFGELARKYPRQIVRALVREVGQADSAKARYQAAFRELPSERWHVFTDPAEPLEAATSALIRKSLSGTDD